VFTVPFQTYRQIGRLPQQALLAAASTGIVSAVFWRKLLFESICQNSVHERLVGCELGVIPVSQFTGYPYRLR